MPPKRRASGPATKSQQQSTLAFHGASNKVTKAGVRAPDTKKNLLPPAAPTKDEKPDVIEIIDEPTTEEAAIIDQTTEEVAAQQAHSTPEEDEARQISEAALGKYWAAKEKQRMAPRVHQQDLSLHEKILREFDMSAHYGVSFVTWEFVRIEADTICDGSHVPVLRA
jgi:DNA polymerase delta subunit 4